MLIIIIFSFLEMFGLAQGLTNCKVFTVSNGKHFTTILDSVISVSPIDCCRRCVSRDGCLSANYKKSTKRCQFVPLPSLALQSHSSTVDASNWDVYTTEDWLLVFRGTAHAAGNVYDAWLYGTNTVTDDNSCMRLDQTACTHHYRNSVVDSWSTMGITQVKLSVFKDGEEKHFISFDGAGTDHVTWFDASRILTSSWSDLKSQLFNLFSIAGYHQRKFYISSLWAGCPGDVGYLIVSSEAPDVTWHSCTWDFHASYPTIMYAESDSGGAIFDSSAGVGEADFIAISISTS